ncbi:hypothetical protein SeMB42_g02574 [Synchytrium endobioticum]|uniref:Anti-proliferative protein domain-containing protein n=1 Tax=Synchytrium endobioticum TaxID=286115 RepID=A0A507DDR4_9FUNG|nr:hypothetical protein SeMB42_g02574 [Synchytrium endobioticum]TPX50897.1 hypothetical protein SeLEV6574_g00627 [Synchytrium endobioticum]
MITPSAPFDPVPSTNSVAKLQKSATTTSEFIVIRGTRLQSNSSLYSNMKTEIDQAVRWLGVYLSKTLPSEKVFQFESSLSALLQDKFKGHWDPARPHVGNAFRSVSINGGRADACLDKALKELGVSKPDNQLPPDLCVWIDPYCVAYKVGEYGHPQTLYCDDQALQILDVPLYFKSPTTRSRSPYSVNRATNRTKSPPASSKNSNFNSNSNYNSNTVTTSAAIPITHPPAISPAPSATSNFVNKNSGSSMTASSPLYPFPQAATRPGSPYTGANGGQTYMLVSAQ